jgi:signal transduction histidine kinase
MRGEIRNFFVILVLCAAFGYFVLSPFAMYMYHAVHMDFPLHEMTVMDVFTPELLSWSLPFAVFGGLVGAIIGMMYLRRKKVEEALQKYTKELEEANKLKGIFTDVLRHDLLNPTGIIKNITEILQMEENLEDSAELEIIRRNVKKLEDTIQNASMYAKLETADKLETKELDLSELVANAIDELGMYSLEKGISIYFEPGGEQKLKASPSIDAIFTNIVSNAIKYSPEGTEIKIEISDDGENKIVSVADQGDGIADEYKEAVFERFTRKDKLGVRGSGLGLAIVKRIVEMHGGRVWVEDNPGGKGSSFFVSLPK